MAFKIKAKRYIEICKKTLKRKTRYKNSPPWNCGYYDGTYLWGDCWCFNPKVILWSESIGQPVCDNYTVGKYYYTEGIKASGMPDETGDAIMNKYCTQVSFAKMLQDKKAPCLLLITGQHMGAYIGEWTQNGKTYNTCEYTSNPSLGNGLCPSYVDQNGARRVYKGGTIIGYWNKAGYLTSFVDYSDSVTESVVTKKLNAEELAAAIISGVVQGQKVGNGQDRINNLKAMGYTETEIRAAQDIINKNLAKTTSTTSENSKKQTATTSSKAYVIKSLPIIQNDSKGEVVTILQKTLKALGFYTGTIDGVAGAMTVTAIKAAQKAWGITVDGSFGPNSWTKLLNS